MINVELLQLPCKVKALSLKNEDDSYTIVLNSRLNAEQQRESFRHEIGHIRNDDFDTGGSQGGIDKIEYFAHKYY